MDQNGSEKGRSKNPNSETNQKSIRNQSQIKRYTKIHIYKTKTHRKKVDVKGKITGLVTLYLFQTQGRVVTTIKCQAGVKISRRDRCFCYQFYSLSRYFQFAPTMHMWSTQLFPDLILKQIPLQCCHPLKEEHLERSPL